MKINKKKVIFIGILSIVVLFIGSYSYLVFNTEENEPSSNTTQLPTFTEVEETYQSKKKALDDIQEEKSRIPPDIYSDFEDSLSQFELTPDPDQDLSFIVKDTSLPKRENLIEEQTLEMRESSILRHGSFFKQTVDITIKNKGKMKSEDIRVEVFGDQTLRTGERIVLRSLEEFKVSGKPYKKHTLIYGIVSLGKNRVFIRIKSLLGGVKEYEAYDEKDGLLGVYIKTSLEGKVKDQVIGNVIDDVQVPGFPKVSGLKKILKRKHRTVKVTVYNSYQLILKEKL